MAAGNPLQSLQEEATCSICLSFFQEPVSLDCGHSFCQACISHCWEGSEAHISCPQCRETFHQRTLRPNRHLGNIVAIAKQLSGQLGGGEDLCPAHQEAFKLFCDRDRVLICVICRESQAHRAHTVLPREEAAQAYKEQIQARLDTLKQEREELLQWKQAGQKQSRDYLDEIEAERQTIVSEFEQLRLFLEKQEQLLLAQLDELNKKMVTLRDENIHKLSEEIARLGDLISEIEEKLQQPTSEFLRDIKSTLSRCEKKCEEPVAVPQGLTDGLAVSAERILCLQEALKKFKEDLPYKVNFLISKAEKEVQTTLETDLENPCSLVSREQMVGRGKPHVQLEEEPHLKAKPAEPHQRPVRHAWPAAMQYRGTSHVRLSGQRKAARWLEQKKQRKPLPAGAMAAGNPLQSLREEATCSVCLSFFQEPVSLDCGHSFCQACISRCWEKSQADVSCPQCRATFPQRTLRPNRQLGNLVAVAKQLSGQPGGGEDLCPAHQEAFKLFCNQDRVLICVICRESQAHRTHTVLPREEAAQAYKEQIQARLDTLKREREELLQWKQAGEKQSRDYLDEIEAERQTIVSEFEQLRLFLEKQEQLLLAQLDELNKKMVTLRVENINKLSEEISRLSDLISEIEEKLQQPTSEFLRDIKSTLSRCEKETCQEPVAVPQDLRDRLCICAQRNVCLQEALKKFKEALPYQLSFRLSKAEKEVQVTQDPHLANPCSVVSVNEGPIQKFVEDTRLYPADCVVGYKGFTSGRCYWEVEVENKDWWILGLAKESVVQEGATKFTPEEGVWALLSKGSESWALTAPRTAVELGPTPEKIGVYLDYEGQKVMFYGVTPSGREPIFTFPASFMGKVVPFFGRRLVQVLKMKPRFSHHKYH
ncbi:zinc finger protein RFP-like [Carettochelys insculpta]|uniref:zinc finger protein RFP-like n=1 Tax=Carettochelys insculpta TaxID=44489 RepID=UPI003EC0E2D2